MHEEMQILVAAGGKTEKHEEIRY